MHAALDQCHVVLEPKAREAGAAAFKTRGVGVEKGIGSAARELGCTCGRVGRRCERAEMYACFTSGSRLELHSSGSTCSVSNLGDDFGIDFQRHSR